MATAEDVLRLRAKANLLREVMRSSEAMHRDAAAAATGTCLKSRVAAIDEAMRPAEARTYDACRVHDNIRRSLRAATSMVRQLDRVREAEHVILNRPTKGLNAYLEAVDKLRSVEHFFTSKRSCRAGDDVLKRVNELLSESVRGLENEFHRLLTKCSKPVELEHIFNCLPSLKNKLSSENLIDPSVNDSSEAQLNQYAEYTLPALVNPSHLTLLSKLAQKSVQLGCHQKFMKIYREIRGSTLELSLKYLGVEYVTKEEVRQVQAERLDAKIAQWIQFFRTTVKLLFCAERVLCDQVFEGKHTWKDHCFAEVTAKSVSTLLSFGEAVVQSQASPEKVFMLLDMYEATLELRSEVEAIFEGNACSENRKSALTLTENLAETAKKTLCDFKENIVNHLTASTTTDGAVHPLTSYVTDYIKFLFDYKSSLKLIYEESSIGDGTDTDMISQIIGFINALETNLDIKSKQYKNHALGHLFLMNNIHYIVRSICRSEMKDLFGADWIQRRRRVVQQHATLYRRFAWRKVLKCLSAQGLTSSVDCATDVTQGSVRNIVSKSSTTSRSVIKGRFRSFNVQFEEACQEMASMSRPPIKAGADAFNRLGPLIENSHNASKYMKYTPESLEQALGNLFAQKLLSYQGC